MGLVGFLFRRCEPFISERRGLFFIKVGLVSVKCAEMLPLSRFLISGRVDCLAPVMINEMPLRADVS